jgi:hypothetical protein
MHKKVVLVYLAPAVSVPSKFFGRFSIFHYERDLLLNTIRNDVQFPKKTHALAIFYYFLNDFWRDRVC